MIKGFCLDRLACDLWCLGYHDFRGRSGRRGVPEGSRPATTALVPTIRLLRPRPELGSGRRRWPVARCSPRFSVSSLEKGYVMDMTARSVHPPSSMLPCLLDRLWPRPRKAASGIPRSGALRNAAWSQSCPYRCHGAARRRVGQAAAPSPTPTTVGTGTQAGAGRIEIQSRAARRHAGADRTLSGRSARANADGGHISRADPSKPPAGCRAIITRT